MYFEGTITLDPSQITTINKIKPTKAFKKFLYHLTLGAISKKEERETFTAVAILQQINAALQAKGIDNIIKISHDDIDFYHDKEGKANDLKLAMDKYEIQINESMAVHFKQLQLVLEHEDINFKYLLEVYVNRDHEVGVYPIEIKVSALLKDFKSEQKTDKINTIVKNQETFEAFKTKKLIDFEYFLEELKLELKKQIELDDIDYYLKTKYVVPNKKKKKLLKALE